MLPAEIKTMLDPPAGGLLLVVTVGHLLRGDDGVGPSIAAAVTSPRPGIVLFDAGEHPERILDRGTTLRPVRTIIIDAADFGGQPGECRLLSDGEVSDRTVSTHQFPLAIVARLLAGDTGGEVIFLGIQPASVALGGGLTEAVRRTAEELAGLLGA